MLTNPPFPGGEGVHAPPRFIGVGTPGSLPNPRFGRVKEGGKTLHPHLTSPLEGEEYVLSTDTIVITELRCANNGNTADELSGMSPLVVGQS